MLARSFTKRSSDVLLKSCCNGTLVGDNSDSLVLKSAFALGVWVSAIPNWHYFLRRFLSCPDLYILSVQICTFYQFMQVLSLLGTVKSNKIISFDIILSLSCYVVIAFDHFGVH